MKTPAPKPRASSTPQCRANTPSSAEAFRPNKGWKLINAFRSLWSAPAPEQVANARRLYIDGVRAGYYCAARSLPVKLTETPTGYTASDATISAWKDPADMELVYTGGNGVWSEPSVGLGSWTEPRCPIAAISGVTITMQQPCWDKLHAARHAS